MCNRCGECCRGWIYLNASPAQLTDPHSKFRHDPEAVDAFVPYEQARGVDGRYTTGWWYTCRRFIEDVGDGMPGCLAHNHRPDLCRRYPYGRTVSHQYPFCTWTTKEKADDA